MAFHAARVAGLVVALLLTEQAFAMGLGEASGRAVLGQPLRLEIPILGSGDRSAPAANCFRLQAPRADVGNDFAARNGRIEVASGPRGARLIVTSAAIVSEPVIGFAVAAGCDIGLARDYVLLVALPAAAPIAPAVDAAASAARAEAQPTKPAEPARLPGVEVLHVDAGLTLEALARQKYPLQPKAREKFMRMMIAANPVLSSGESPIAAGTELRLPAGLPQRRTGPYRGENAQPKAAAASEGAASPAPKAPPRGRKAGKDRLVLGAVAETNEAKLLAEAERLAGILLEQNKAQDELIANIAKLEADYGSLRQQFAAMQAGLARAEAERAAAQRTAEDSRATQVIELLLAVLAGGAAGGAGLHLAQRRRNAARAAAGGDTDDADIEESPAVMPMPEHRAVRPPPALQLREAVPAEVMAPPPVPPAAPAPEPSPAPTLDVLDVRPRPAVDRGNSLDFHNS